METEKMEPAGSELNTDLRIDEYKEAEWVFQFDNDEPVVFAWTNQGEEGGEVNLSIKSNSQSRITFSNIEGNKVLSIYSRPLSEDIRKMRKV